MATFRISTDLPEWKILEKVSSFQKKLFKHENNFKINMSIGDSYSHATVEHGVIFLRNVTITVPDMIVSGWKFLAKIDHLEGGNVILNMSDDDMSAYRHASAKCEHCKTNRIRYQTYVLVNTFTGEKKQVGSTCVKDFIQSSWSHVNKIFSSVQDFLEPEMWNEWGCSNRSSYSLSGILATTIEIIRSRGWVSKSHAKEFGGFSTADYVVDYIRQYSTCRDIDALERAEKIIEFFRNEDFPENNDYLNNIKALMSRDILNEKYIGYIVSSVPTYEKMIAERNRPKIIESEYLGKVKERLRDIQVTVTRVIRKETIYGITTIISMVDENGNSIVTFATTHKDINPGEKYSITGTVKSHEIYNGAKQTCLTRVVFS